MSLAFPRFPALGAQLLRIAPLALASQRFIASVARRHPSLFERLGPQVEKTFLIDATDLPIVFLLRPRPRRPVLEVHRRGAALTWDARVAGLLSAFLGMLHGACDGDALFFSRDLIVEGDTEAVLALRNALDDAELDLPTEIAALLGPFEAIVSTPLRHGLPILERLTGVALSRVDNHVDNHMEPRMGRRMEVYEA